MPSPFELIIDDMENISAWTTFDFLELSNSTDAVEGIYSTNITYDCNINFSQFRAVLKNVSSFNINFTQYDALEFVAKFVNVPPDASMSSIFII
ncbi:MAG: hypothetical protein ACTSR3_08600 [Candidatus Helarchaeota archaeon]